MNEFRHKISIGPDTMDGQRGWWYAEVDGEYDGQGRTIEEALCDLVDSLKHALDKVDPPS